MPSTNWAKSAASLVAESSRDPPPGQQFGDGHADITTAETVEFSPGGNAGLARLDRGYPADLSRQWNTDARTPHPA